MRKFLSLFVCLGVLSACVEPFEPQYLEPTAKSEFANERHEAKFVDFSNVRKDFWIVRVQAPFDYPRGTIVVDPNARFVYLMEDEGLALRYPIAVGKDGFEWSGSATIARRAKWPSWHPTPEMKERNSSLPDVVDGGRNNPLGARALYLYDANGHDTLYRIHGTSNPASIGTASSSGCIRMFNEHVIDLYNRVPNGSPVVVMPLLLPGATIAPKEPETFEEYMTWLGNQIGGNAAVDDATEAASAVAQ